MRKIKTAAAILALAASGSSPVLAKESASQSAFDRFAGELDYRYKVVSNRPDCPASISNCFLSTISLTLPADLPADLPREGLSLYFSYVNQLPLVESDIFEHRQINGDVQRLTLKPGAKLRPGARHEIRLWGVGNQFSRFRAMPNAYLVAEGVEPRVIASTRVKVDPDTGLDTLPFLAPMTDEAQLARQAPVDETRWLTAERAFEQQAERAAPAAKGFAILPKPREAQHLPGARVDLTRGVALKLDGVTRDQLTPALTALAGAGVAEGGKLPLTIEVGAAGFTSESYALQVARGGIAIRAGDLAGAHYALRSLAQQAAFEKGQMRPLRVADRPEYVFRGLHVDVARNFHSRDQMLKLLDGMAAFKLNRLHLHLADDEGWRLEVPALPELTEVGAKRCHDPSETRCLLPQLGAGPNGEGGADGYFSVADYVDIVRAAAARQIEVIPSIDTPGHSRAAVRSMEARAKRLLAAGDKAGAAEYRLIDPADTTRYRSIQHYDDNTVNVCLPSTYRFIDTVVDALAEMHQQAGAPLKVFHLGADETAGAWVNSPACQAMIAENGGKASELGPRFIEKVAKQLEAKGIRTAGWSDGMGHTRAAAMPANAQTNIWGVLHQNAVRETHEQLARGWETVLSIPDVTYFDMPHTTHPADGGYDWAARVVDEYGVFGFMPDNLPANAATMRDIMARARPIADDPVRGAGQRIAGLQGQLWSETIRIPARADYMLFPRLLALAERAWAPADWAPAYRAGQSYEWQDKRVDHAALKAGWQDFAGRVAAQFPMLDRLDIAYRVAPPGARIKGGMLEANSVFPGTAIEYRASGGDWTPYAGPVAVNGVVELRSRSADGRRTSRTVQVKP
ncbi:family 20 glycosylhydrolase [Sphingopyxis sp. MWB1]|uniref:family 20 glycosylhydrolase n=1 Tax=Sphingopyxis sp. MWB1 TaxID=1537715 RepID=UPI000A7C8B52|nr:family 20 glycosylhydrolase [Sphingopyxis sp. MWB1]